MPSEKRHKPAQQKSARYAYEGLDRVIHEKARLGIMTCLLTRPDGLMFTDLKALCDLTDGNLNRHLDVLREAGFVELRKDQGERRTRTVCRVTSAGRASFLKYLAELERVVTDGAAAAQAVKGIPLSARPGWSTT